jgi:hypothetical protein
MIDIKSLRIGNWVGVECTTAQTGTVLKPIQQVRGVYWLVWLSDWIETVDPVYLHHLPLTSEILEKCPIPGIGPKSELIKKMIENGEIKWVDQYQNIVYSLTGIDLQPFEAPEDVLDFIKPENCI